MYQTRVHQRINTNYFVIGLNRDSFIISISSQHVQLLTQIKLAERSPINFLKVCRLYSDTAQMVNDG